MNVEGEEVGHVIIELRLDAAVARLALVAAVSLSERHFLSLENGFRASWVWRKEGFKKGFALHSSNSIMRARVLSTACSAFSCFNLFYFILIYLTFSEGNSFLNILNNYFI